MSIFESVTPIFDPDAPLEEFKFRKTTYIVRFFHGTPFEWSGTGLRPHKKFDAQIPSRCRFVLFPEADDGFEQWLEWDDVGFDYLDDVFEAEEYQRQQIPSGFVGKVGWGTLRNYTKWEVRELLPHLLNNIENCIVKNSPNDWGGIRIGFNYETNLGPIFFPNVDFSFSYILFKKCKGCGLQFRTTYQYRQFHSEQCRIQYHNRKRKFASERTCLICGSDISMKNSGATTCCPAHRTALCRKRKREKGS